MTDKKKSEINPDLPDNGGADDPIEKSQKSKDDLLAGLAALQEIGASRPDSRREELCALAARGTLSKGQRAELNDILDGSDRSLEKSLREGNDELSKALDVSPALDTLGSKVAESVDALADTLQKSLADQGEFNDELAKSFVALGSLVADLTDAVAEIADGPARAPKADVGGIGDGSAIEKSLDTPDTKPEQGEGLNRRAYAAVLERVVTDRLEKGLDATAQTNELSRVCANRHAKPNPQILAEANKFAAGLKS